MSRDVRHGMGHRRGEEPGGGAAVAERVGGIVYTSDPTHMQWLRDAGARITVMPVPL